MNRIYRPFLILLPWSFCALGQINFPSVTNSLAEAARLDWRIAALEPNPHPRFLPIITNQPALETELERTLNLSNAAENTTSVIGAEAIADAEGSRQEPLQGEGLSLSSDLTLSCRPEQPADRPVEHLSLATLERPFDQQIYERLDRAGYLTRPELPDDSLLARIGESFEPAPIQLGKTTITCSVWTAIKRKNPLALLNPLVISASW